MAANTAPAERGFRIRQRQRDVRAHNGSAIYPFAIYSWLGRLPDFRLFLRHRVAILLVACAFVCLAPPALAQANSVSENSGHDTLKIWPETEKQAFLLDDLHGAPHALQAFAGHVVLVHFFATWCEPCVREMASLQKLADRTHGKPLAIIAIDVAEVDLRVRRFFEKRQVTFPVLLDRDRSVTKAWKVSALPSTFVLAPDLMPRLFVERDLDWSQPDVLAAIEALYPANTGSAAQSDVPRPATHTTNNPSEETTR